MRTASVRAGIAFAQGRLDAKFHCSEGVVAAERILMLKAAGLQTRTVAGPGGYGSIGALSRTKRVYAGEGEAGLPYLRPYDVFDYLPQPADSLSERGSTGIDSLIPAVGTILQTCSGRNLGPLAYVDEYLSRFVISDDMLRLSIDDERDRLYVLAFLSTPTGQALLKRSKTGNVIDHLAAGDLAGVEVPRISEPLIDVVVDGMRRAVNIRQYARAELDASIEAARHRLPDIQNAEPLRTGWTARASGFGDRMDAAFWDPALASLRADLQANGCVRLGDYADPFLPNWYKRHYVEIGHGRPIVSGRQLLQASPVNLQYLAARSLEFANYELGEGTIAFGARGRAEDRLSQPALVTKGRAQWLGSENVMRIRPKEGVNPGWLYLALATPQAQAQIRSATYGAVVDVVDVRRLGDVLILPPDEALGERARIAWDGFDEARSVETASIDLVERAVLDAAS